MPLLGPDRVLRKGCVVSYQSPALTKTSQQDKEQQEEKACAHAGNSTSSASRGYIFFASIPSIAARSVCKCKSVRRDPSQALIVQCTCCADHLGPFIFRSFTCSRETSRSGAQQQLVPEGQARPPRPTPGTRSIESRPPTKSST